MQNPPGMHQGKCLYDLQDAFHSEIRNLEKLGILEETKDVTEWVNSFVIMEREDSRCLQQSTRTGNYKFA